MAVPDAQEAHSVPFWRETDGFTGSALPGLRFLDEKVA